MKTEAFYAKGRRECNATVEVASYGEHIVASVEGDQITMHQLKAALQREYPDYSWSVSTHREKHFAYWIAHGRRE